MKRKNRIVHFVVVALLSSFVLLQTSQAVAAPSCGPAQFAKDMNSFCGKFKPTFWDILGSAFVPAYGLTKAVVYSACKGVANSGYLVDLMVGDCCVQHDACYSRGGDSSCKSSCDTSFLYCTHSKIATYAFGWDMALKLYATASIGGYGTFSWTGDPYCGQ